VRRSDDGTPLRILVTGSSGVLGRALAPVLESSGHRVVPFDLKEPHGPAVKEGQPHDVTRLDAVRAAVKGFDGVVHLAAVSQAAPAEVDPLYAQKVNVEGTRTVLEALRWEGSPAWFVLASSREVYGDPNGLPVDEEHPIRPKGVYGHTKAEAEQVVRDYCRPGGRQAIVLRFTNVFGDPRDHPERVVPSFVSAALRGKTLEVRGPDTVLDLLHVSDAVAAIVRTVAVLRDGVPGVEAINIATGRGTRLGDLARKVTEITRSRSEIRNLPPVGWTSSAYVGNVAKAARLLSWRPTVDLDRGLETLIRESREG